MTLTSTLNSANLRSINREVNSNTSAEIVSFASGTGSSKAKGGNSESGMSTNSGCCFSRSTRALFTISTGARTICIGFAISTRPRNSSTNSSRSSAAASPNLRSSSLSRRSRKRLKASSRDRPTFSATSSQEKCRNKDRPAQRVKSKTRVEPVKPRVICNGSPINSPKMPPGGLGSSQANECKRMDSRPILLNKVSPKPSQRIIRESGLASGSGGKGILQSSRQPPRTRRPKSTTHQKAEIPKI